MRARFASRFAYVLCVSGFLVFLCAGCEEDVTAVLGTEKAFSLYGLVTPDIDTQWVRVYPIEDVLQPPAGAPLDVTVTSTDLESGGTRIWTDSVITDGDGHPAHIFWSPFRAVYGHTYRLEVARPDGASSRVDAIVPPRTEVEQLTPTTSFPITAPLLLPGDLPRLMKLELDYEIKFREGPSSATTAIVTIPYEGRQNRVAEGWIVRANLSEDFSALRAYLQEAGNWSPTFGIIVLNMNLRLIVASADWNPPGGVFDPEVLVQPGVLNNVENGFGFVGAGYRIKYGWRPADETLKAAGFNLLK